MLKKTIAPLLHFAGAAVLVIFCAADVQAIDQAAAQAQLDRKLLADFEERVDDYMKLHEKLQKQGTRQNKNDNVLENRISQQALAMRIRSERDDARPGDLFRKPIAMALRRALNPELRGVAATETREAIREDAPPVFVLAVNASYPPGASRATMPANVLGILPPLPKGLEYRIVGTHLLLMDIEANIIVDYILDVMCKTC